MAGQARGREVSKWAELGSLAQLGFLPLFFLFLFFFSLLNLHFEFKLICELHT